MKGLILPCLLAFLLPGCVSFDEASLQQICEEAELPMRQGPAPSNAEELQFLYYEQTGFYLFGLAPIVPSKIEPLLKRMAEDAKKLGADGVASLDIELKPPSFFKFSVFPLPDWTASARVQGSAYRLTTPKMPQGGR